MTPAWLRRKEQTDHLTDHQWFDHHGGDQPGPTLSSPLGAGRKWPSTFSRPFHLQPTPLHNWQSPTQLPLAPALPFALPPCHGSPPPSTVPPPAAWRPGHTAPKTIKRKTGDGDSYPPGLYVALDQNQYFRHQYNGLLTPGSFRSLHGPHKPRGRQMAQAKRDHATGSVPRFFRHYFRNEKNAVHHPPPCVR